MEKELQWKTKTIDEHYIYYDDLEIPYEVIRSKRKSLAIAISIGGNVTIKIPWQATKADVIRLLETKRDWIYHSYKKQVVRTRNGIEVKEGASIPFLDKAFRLHIQHNSSKNVADIAVQEDIVLIETPVVDSDFIIECLETWYKKNAKHVITMRAEQYAKAMGVSYGKISIRSQKSRWGSCSSLGNLNFNWHLIMMPSNILDYVVVHELAHRIEMNHSAQFWQIVSEFCPAYKQRKAWLKEKGMSYELLTK
ncbi:M48 family metallopeptidase [Anaerosporobacter sp.]|uniref:M48 family metallopeptidase n=1 Tax=Anaerosporobacter sp. TaxID=1872529 RepID=UPI00286EC81F|nr:SprT family zinc-dependent metalloprotease [Anaerosporobacter sp.]